VLEPKVKMSDVSVPSKSSALDPKNSDHVALPFFANYFVASTEGFNVVVTQGYNGKMRLSIVGFPDRNVSKKCYKLLRRMSDPKVLQYLALYPEIKSTSSSSSGGINNTTQSTNNFVKVLSDRIGSLKIDVHENVNNIHQPLKQEELRSWLTDSKNESKDVESPKFKIPTPPPTTPNYAWSNSKPQSPQYDNLQSGAAQFFPDATPVHAVDVLSEGRPRTPIASAADFTRNYKRDSKTEEGVERAGDNVEYVTHAVSEDFTNYFREFFPDVDIRVRGGGRTMVERRPPSQHATAAMERRLLEKFAYEHIRRVSRRVWIVDVGGNPSRHVGFCRSRIHVCAPNLLDSDHFRRLEWTGEMKEITCDHRVEDCTCIKEEFVLLMVHSIYYFTPVEIVRLLEKCGTNQLVSVHHKFGFDVGMHFGGEGKYTRDGENITEYFQGGSPYTHANLDWMHGNGITIRDGMKKSRLSWSVLRETPNSIVHQFAITQGGETVVEKPVTVQVSSDLDVRSVEMKKRSTMKQPIQPILKEYEVLDYTSWWYYYLGWLGGDTVSRTRRVKLPSQVMDLVKMDTGSLRRFDPQTNQAIQSTVQHIRNSYINACNNYNLTSKFVAETASDASVYLFTDVEFDKVVMKNIDRDDLRERPRYNFWRKLRFRGGLSVLTAGMSYLLWKNRESVAERVKIRKRVLMTMLVGVCAALTWRGFSMVRVKQVEGWVKNQLGLTKAEENFERFLQTGKVVKPCHTLDVCMDGKIVPKTVREGTVIEIDQSKRNCRPKPALEPKGIIITADGKPFVPKLMRMCTDNELLGLTNRVVPHVTYDPNETADLDHFVKENIRQMVPHRGDISTVVGLDPDMEPMSFEEWVTTYPGPRKQALIYAMNKFRENPEMKVSCMIRAFVKVESLCKETAPRIIQSRDDVYLALLGPFFRSFNKMLARDVWNSDFSITYASGFTLEELGYVHQKKWVRSGCGRLLEFDQSCFDGSLLEHLLLLPTYIYFFMRYLKKNKLLTSLLRAQLKTILKTWNAIFAKFTGSRCSGDANTSCDNSIINALCLAFALIVAGVRLACLGGRAEMMVAGDDNKIYLPPDVDADEICETVVAVLKKLGLSPKGKVVEFHTVEFCSKKYYPCRYEYKGEIVLYKPGPKIGKTLHKVGFMRVSTENEDDWWPSVVYGLRKDWSHVPFLRTILKYVRETHTNLNRLGETKMKNFSFHSSAEHLSDEERLHQWMRDAYEREYDITALEQEFYDQMVRSGSFPMVVENPIIADFIRMDV